MKKVIIAGFLLSGLMLSACGKNTDKADNNEDHIWKTQTDALKQAQQLQGTLNAESERKEKQLEEIDK